MLTSQINGLDVFYEMTMNISMFKKMFKLRFLFFYSYRRSLINTKYKSGLCLT